MKHLKNLLVAIDGSAVSSAAVSFAIRLAKRVGASLSFCNAIDVPEVDAARAQPDATLEVSGLLEPLERSRSALVAATEAAKRAGVASTTSTLLGTPAKAIFDAAASKTADAIVMGTHGYDIVETLLRGSVADEVLHGADVPVFIVRAAASSASDAPLSHIAVAIDEPDSAAGALDLAFDLAKAENAEVSILHVMSLADRRDVSYAALHARAHRREGAEEALASRARLAQRRGIAVELVLLQGEPATSVLDFVRKREIDLLAMGTHRERSLGSNLLGSVAEVVIRASTVPVVVVRQPSTHGSQERPFS